nr:4Fe-4S cluster-binding domain-containing protein [Anaerococcus sp. AGMB09787]
MLHQIKLYNNEQVNAADRSDSYDYLVDNYFSSKKENDNKEISFNLNNIKNVQLKISNTCNMSCDYFYANKGNCGKNDSLMNIDVTNKAIDFINNNLVNVEKVSFFGGELLLNYESISMFLHKLRNKDTMYSTVTNGTLLNKNLLN